MSYVNRMCITDRLIDMKYNNMIMGRSFMIALKIIYMHININYVMIYKFIFSRMI